MIGKLFKRRQPRKFNYIPRHYDTRNHDLIYNRIGDGKFAQGYTQKKKARTGEVAEEKNIDFSSYRIRPKMKDKKSPLNMLLIVVMMILIMIFIWVILKFLELSGTSIIY